MNPLDARLGIPVHRSRRVEIGEVLSAGEGGLFVHPLTLEKMLAVGAGELPIDDWEALRRSVVVECEERWRHAAKQWENAA